MLQRVPSKGSIQCGLFLIAALGILQLFFFLMTEVNCEMLQISKNVSPLIRKGNQWRFKGTSEFGDCSEHAFSFHDSGLEVLGSGYTKKVYQLPDGRAIKRIAFFGPSVTECFDKNKHANHAEHNCLNGVTHSFITEINYLLLLQNDSNIPRLHGYCIPYDFIKNAPDFGIIIDAGNPVDAILLAQSDWRARVQMLDEILVFLKRNKKLQFRDIRRQQFVMIKNRPKLVDLDDVVVTDTSESNDLLKRLYNGFVKDFFFHNHPKSAITPLSEIQQRFKNLTLNVSILRRLTEELTVL